VEAPKLAAALSAAIVAILGQCTGTHALSSVGDEIFMRLVVAAWHSMAWRERRSWERMADHKEVYDASHLVVANACTGTRMLARSCWMSATVLSLYGVSRAGHIHVLVRMYVSTPADKPDPNYRASTSLSAEWTTANPYYTQPTASRASFFFCRTMPAAMGSQ
jgi:hypothetical protein